MVFVLFSGLVANRCCTLSVPRLVLSVRLFDLCLFGFVSFIFLLVSWKGCGLWLWHSLTIVCPVVWLIIVLSGSCLKLWSHCWVKWSWLHCFLLFCFVLVGVLCTVCHGLFALPITKTRLFKYTENFTTKQKWKFSEKKNLIVFMFLLKT